VSVLVEEKMSEWQGQKDEHDVVGVDLGIKTLATISDGKTYENPKPLKTKLRKLKRIINMSEKLYRLYCDYCHYNRWSNGSDIQDLVQYKRSPVDTTIPKYDPKAKKIITKSPVPRAKQFKCPKCGRLITPKKYNQNEENKDTGSQTSSA
jgi:predicted RNA-binding Zn-ribbon protein involved in translation (DUF1610 family)